MRVSVCVFLQEEDQEEPEPAEQMAGDQEQSDSFQVIGSQEV